MGALTMAARKLQKTPFESIAAYVDPVSARSYGTVVLSNGTHLAATDGFGLAAVAAERPAGAYRPSGEESPVKPPEFAALLRDAVESPGRTLDAAEYMVESIAALPKRNKYFVGIPKAAGDRVVVVAGPVPRWEAYAWFSGEVLRKWMFGAETFKLCDDGERLVGTAGPFTYLAVGIRLPEEKKS